MDFGARRGYNGLPEVPVWLIASAAWAVDCPEGHAAVGDGCVVLAGEILAPAAPELYKALWTRITGSEDVRRCLVPWLGRPDVPVSVTADVAQGAVTGLWVTSASAAPGEVEWCLASEVAKLPLPQDPGTYRFTMPLTLRSAAGGPQR